MTYRQFDIAMLVGGLKFDEHSLDRSGLGGSETAGLCMAKELSKLGHRVTMFCLTPDDMYGTGADGVTYMPLEAFAKFSQGVPHDVTIVQRVPEAFSHRISSKLNLLWQHDLAQLRSAPQFRGTLWNVDKVMLLSEFMAQQYRDVYSLEEESVYITRNGIELSRINQVPNQSKSRHGEKHLVYTSRPERGLDVLLGKVMPELLQRDPSWKLTIAGYDNQVSHLADFYQGCKLLAARLGGRVQFVGALPKQKLYELYKSATALVYPTPSPVMPNFAEVSCITAMEAQACGLPIVTCNVGALSETCATGAATLCELVNGSLDVPEFVDAIEATGVEGVWRRMSTAGIERGSTLDWSGVAEDWSRMFEREIRRKSGNPSRLVRHLWRQSDIVAIKHLLSTRDLPPAAKRDADKLISDWAFMDIEDGYRLQYEKIGSGHDDYVIDTVPGEPRFKILAQWLAQNPDLKTVLDYGCAHGSYATRLAEALPHLHIHGVDIDKYSIDMARGFAQKLSVTDRATFDTWPNGIPSKVSKLYDVVLAQEVLEHVPDPWTVMDRLEAHAKDGGKVHITVPIGPWEYDSYRSYLHRCHIWHFDRHDLMDMFGKKADLNIEAYHHGDSQSLGEALGWWIISYTVNGEPTGQIDLERKLWLQAPRETVSVQMLAGPGVEETLLWNLKSLVDVADEIRIIDCGMSELARAMAGNFNAVLVKAQSPRESGFEEARNVGLDTVDRSSFDWVFWIDTDEKLIGVPALQKYLRNNGFMGYGIRQHHFAVDTQFPADMPVRFFRLRERLDGKSMRFYGQIHEHPELGLNEGPGSIIVMSDAHIAHVGYLDESIRRGRFMRNLPLLQRDMQKYPERLLQKHFVMRDLIHIVRYTMSMNGGKLTSDLRAKCEEVIKLYRTHFLGKMQYMNSDSRGYYSEAVRLLGRGFDAALMVEVGKTGVQPGGQPILYRFDTAEDLQKEMARMIEDRTKAFSHSYY